MTHPPGDGPFSPAGNVRPGDQADAVIRAPGRGEPLVHDVRRALGSAVGDLLSPWLGPVVAGRAGQTVAGVVTNLHYPMAALFFALLFVLVQHRLDARDPKLAGAALSRRDDEICFPDLFPSLGEVT
jgi:hypothetical protein